MAKRRERSPNKQSPTDKESSSETWQKSSYWSGLILRIAFCFPWSGFPSIAGTRYFAETVGQTEEGVIRRYIQEQWRLPG